MAFLASGPRPPGMPSPAPTNKDGSGCPAGWKSPYGLVSGYPVAPNGDVLPWSSFCTKYPFACPPNWSELLGHRVFPARSRTSWPAGFYGPSGGRPPPALTPFRPRPPAPRAAPSGATPSFPTPMWPMPPPPPPPAPRPPPVFRQPPTLRPYGAPADAGGCGGGGRT